MFVFFKLGITFEPFLLNLKQKNHFFVSNCFAQNSVFAPAKR